MYTSNEFMLRDKSQDTYRKISLTIDDTALVSSDKTRARCSIDGRETEIGSRPAAEASDNDFRVGVGLTAGWRVASIRTYSDEYDEYGRGAIVIVEDRKRLAM